MAWRPRDENEEADALTNGAFGGFEPAPRVQVVWNELALLVLPRYAAAAEKMFLELKEAKAAVKRPRPLGSGRQVRLRERDPW